MSDPVFGSEGSILSIGELLLCDVFLFLELVEEAINSFKLDVGLCVMCFFFVREGEKNMVGFFLMKIFARDYDVSHRSQFSTTSGDACLTM